LVIEKASIAAEIARLARLWSQHAEAQYHIPISGAAARRGNSAHSGTLG
jgi:hypothetical protein